MSSFALNFYLHVNEGSKITLVVDEKGSKDRLTIYSHSYDGI